MQGQSTEDIVPGQPVGVGLMAGGARSHNASVHFCPPDRKQQQLEHGHNSLNNPTGKRKYFLPFMWYTEASEYPLLNRRMRDKQKANTSQHPLTECNMVNE